VTETSSSPERPRHALNVCVSCRPAGTPPDAPRDGRKLFDTIAALHAAWPLRADVVLNGVECMSGCDRACTVGLSAPGKPSYLFGDKTPTIETAAAALELAARYLVSETGTLPRGERPAIFRSRILARIPAPPAE
jgi:predicted metal-binding protein